MNAMGNSIPEQSVINISHTVFPLSKDFFDRGKWLREQGWNTPTLVQKCMESTPYYSLDSYETWGLVQQQNAMESVSYKTYKSEFLLSLKTIGDLKFAQTGEVWDQFVGFPLQSVIIKDRCQNKNEFLSFLNQFRQCLDASKKSDLIEKGIEFEIHCEVFEKNSEIKKFTIKRVNTSLKDIGCFQSKTLNYRGFKFWDIEINEHYSVALGLDTVTLKNVGGLDFFIVIYNKDETNLSIRTSSFNRNSLHVTTLCDWYPISEPFTNKSAYSFYSNIYGLIAGIDSGICMFKNLVNILRKHFLYSN